MTVLYTRWRFAEFYLPEKKSRKIRQTLFTFELHSAELLSIWRDFLQKILNSNFEFFDVIAVILGDFKIKIDLPL